MRIRPDERLPLQPPADMAPRARRPLRVPYIFQRHPGWCWAACIAMAGEYLETSADSNADLAKWSLPRVVEDRLGCQGCEEASPDDSCTVLVQRGNIEGKWAESKIEIAGIAVKESALRQAIESHGRPVQIFYSENHAVMVVGVFQDDDRRRGFLVHDPYEQEGFIPREIGALEQQQDQSGEGLEILGLLAE